MLENLVESRPKRPRTRGQVALSVILHALLIYGAVQATAPAVETMKAILADTTMIWLKPPEPPPPPPPPPEIPKEQIYTDVLLPLGFQTVMPPTEMPKELPEINLTERFNPEDFSGKGVEGGVARGVVGGTGSTEPVTGEASLAENVDDPVSPINQPKPRYPPVLQQAGIQGFVEARYVVDTTGRAEPASWKVLSSTHQQFEPSAREAAMKSTFKPARIKGRPVRQLVQQLFTFKIGQ